MKKLWIFIIGLCTLLFIWNFSQAKDYEYTNLSIISEITSDWTMNITENYTANFFVNKHWIIRSIPLNYSTEWIDFHIDVSNINVNWKKFSTSKENWTIEIKIGDADRTVIWEQNYPISYTTYGLIRNFSWKGYAELYWNLVWYDFDTNINNVRVEIFLPKTYTWFTSDDFLIAIGWTTYKVGEFPWQIDWSKWNRITISYDKWLPAFKWITLAIRFPTNYFTFDHDRQAKLLWKTKGSWLQSLWNSLSWIIEFFWIIAVIIIAVIKGSKNKNKIDIETWGLKWEFADQFPVIAQYEPPKWLNSAEVWLLLHRGAQAKDMLSLIYKRANEWLITLSVEESEWSVFKKATNCVIITKNKDIPEEYPEFEKDFFKALVRSEKNKIEQTTNLYSRLSLSSLEKHGEDKLWFNKRRNKWGLAFFWIIWIFILIELIEEVSSSLSLILFIIVFFVLVPLLWNNKLKETEEGARLISHILWYRQFLAACDENKLRLFLQQDPLYFDKILPYAVVFWLDTELLKKIEPLMQEMGIRSSLYSGDINAIHIINDTLSSSATHSVAPSASYSSSGWFSWWSSFWGGFSGWWGGWGWGWRSW